MYIKFCCGFKQSTNGDDNNTYSCVLLQANSRYHYQSSFHSASEYVAWCCFQKTISCFRWGWRTLSWVLDDVHPLLELYSWSSLRRIVTDHFSQRTNLRKSCVLPQLEICLLLWYQSVEWPDPGNLLCWICLLVTYHMWKRWVDNCMCSLSLML